MSDQDWLKAIKMRFRFLRPNEAYYPGNILQSDIDNMARLISEVESLRRELADSQEHAQAEQDRADSHWKKVEGYQDQVRELEENHADIADGDDYGYAVECIAKFIERAGVKLNPDMGGETGDEAEYLAEQILYEIGIYKDKLLDRDVTICGMREALEALSAFWAYGLDKPAGVKPDDDDLRRAENLGIMIRDALSSSPTCPHKEELDRAIRQKEEYILSLQRRLSHYESLVAIPPIEYHAVEDSAPVEVGKPEVLITALEHRQKLLLAIDQCIESMAACGRHAGAYQTAIRAKANAGRWEDALSGLKEKAK